MDAGRTLISQAEYARRRGISKEAVSKRTVSRGGPIPVHGPAKQIDPDEADRLWEATITSARAGTGSRWNGKGAASAPSVPATPRPRGRPPKAPPAPDLDPAQAAVEETLGAAAPEIANAARAGGPVAQARIASALIKAQTDKINLDKLRGALIEKSRANRTAFVYTRRIRDAWMNWPSRVGPELAAKTGCDQHLLTTELENLVRQHLADLADGPIDL